MEAKHNTHLTDKMNAELAWCEMCKMSPWKYKCPCCEIRTCSLPCVNAHKHQTSCTGRRQQTRFVPLSNFNDNVLVSDYNLLENVKRVSESARRMRANLCGYPYFKLPYHLKSLRSAAASRRIKLLILPSGMLRREKNKSQYYQRQKLISWTIEWRFHGTDVILYDHRVNERTDLSCVIQRHLKPSPWNHCLRQFCDFDLGNLCFFIRKYPKGARSPYRKLDIYTSLREQLANLVILEYPTIHVLLPTHSHDFDIINDSKLSREEPKLSCSCKGLSPIGIIPPEEETTCPGKDSNPIGTPFKEETIGNDGSSEDSHSRETDIPKCDREVEEHVNTGGPNESGMDFVFEQCLIDTYSDLISQVNPDDFLNFGGNDPLDFLHFGGWDDGFGQGGSDSKGNKGVPTPYDDLEEGEIVE